MRPPFSLVLGLVLVALGGAGAAAGAVCAGGDVDRLLARRIPSVESFSLANGLRVHLVPREGDRTVSVRVAYDVGARDEAPGRGGVAHLFEHMMFKGSERVPDGGHFRIVRDVGGRTNAGMTAIRSFLGALRFIVIPSAGAVSVFSATPGIGEPIDVEPRIVPRCASTANRRG